jgi:hypothetical protein
MTCDRAPAPAPGDPPFAAYKVLSSSSDGCVTASGTYAA